MSAWKLFTEFLVFQADPSCSELVSPSRRLLLGELELNDRATQSLSLSLKISLSLSSTTLPCSGLTGHVAPSSLKLESWGVTEGVIASVAAVASGKSCCLRLQDEFFLAYQWQLGFYNPKHFHTKENYEDPSGKRRKRIG